MSGSGINKKLLIAGAVGGMLALALVGILVSDQFESPAWIFLVVALMLPIALFTAISVANTHHWQNFDNAIGATRQGGGLFLFNGMVFWRAAFEKQGRSGWYEVRGSGNPEGHRVWFRLGMDLDRPLPRFRMLYLSRDDAARLLRWLGFRPETPSGELVARPAAVETVLRQKPHLAEALARLAEVGFRRIRCDGRRIFASAVMTRPAFRQRLQRWKEEPAEFDHVFDLLASFAEGMPESLPQGPGRASPVRWMLFGGPVKLLAGAGVIAVVTLMSAMIL